MNETNGKGNGHDPAHEREDNVIRIPTLAERDRIRREQEKQWQKQYRAANPGEPLINLPPVTKVLVLLLVGIHLALTLTLGYDQLNWVYENFGFKPAYYTVNFPGWPAIVGPFTYMFLHGNWLHIGMNGVMMMAFGAGVEKWMGGKRMLILFLSCSLAAAALQFVLTPTSDSTMIGASGGLSGLFAAVVIMLRAQGRLGTGRYGILPFALFWIGISALFGMLGGPDGSIIAWAAHIGGFLAGLVLVKPIMRIK